MKKLALFGMGVCVVLAFTSCKSSESAYKKAYEKAKQQELAEPQTTASVDVTPVATTAPAAPVAVKVKKDATVRQEKVTVVSGSDALKEYSVVCGSFGLKANAEGLKDFLDSEGYNATIAFNAEAAMYRVIVSTYSDKATAADARDAFKAKYPNRKDFQGSWLLYRVY
ncbi:SPOR domain-containing protein [uncultured Bacteroides sp.]|uniref:SPOR domain-containing protein n=1 Tax=uncultured Bacteroides sp. TaxID=162156 RepID=UPI002AABC677|nr:SPOR domain-containing protein [uncultured Bacteroides sp.]